jgi:spore coat protein A, manganese oxidase
MFADRNCFKPAMKLFFGFVLAGSFLCARAPAQQLTSCTVANPSTPCIQKFVDPLPYPPFFHSNRILNGAVDDYEIAARQFKQQMLSTGTNDSSGHQLMTTVWGYGQNNVDPVTGVPAGPYNDQAPTTVCSGTDPTQANCFLSPAPTILTVGTGVHVRWINDVVCHVGDTGCMPGHFITYPAGVRPSFTNHTSNPTGICNGAATTPSDCKGVGGYMGPVPLIVHAHGEISASEDDGIPEAWNLPKTGTFDPSQFPFPKGSDWCQANPATFNTTVSPARDPNCSTDYQTAGNGSAKFTYPNRQFGTTLFFHDHALGVTTENVYMGLAGFYLISGTNLSPGTDPTKNWCNGNSGTNTNCAFTFADDLPSDCSSRADGNCLGISPSGPVSSVTGGLPQGDCTATGFAQTPAIGCHLIPLAITDKAFNTDGSLKFSENGNVIVVNGKTWPFLNVEPRKYRFKIVVAAPTSRFDLTFPSSNNNDNGAGGPTPTMTQIGADGGYLPHPATITKLSLMPGERADVIVDFSSFFSCVPPFSVGCPTSVDLRNANGSGDTGTIMRFNIVPFASCDQTNPTTCTPFTNDTSCNLFNGSTKVLSCTSADTLPHRTCTGTQSASDCGATPGTATVRQVSLFDDHLGNCPNPGCVSSTPLPWDATVTETPTVAKTEIWEMYDFQDSHPMHLHEAQFEVLGRVNMATGVVSPPAPGERGFKDTVQANAGQITRIRVIFQGPVGPTGNSTPEQHPGLFAWHCHINPHEDNEMMRPMCVQYPASDPDPKHQAANTNCINTP